MSAKTKVTKTKTAAAALKQETYTLSDLKHHDLQFKFTQCGPGFVELGDSSGGWAGSGSMD
jgi:hypothetical protein